MLGANGVGKTTLNKVLSGVVAARSGTIRFDGRAITRASASAIVEAGLIHVPEGRKIFPNLSVRENLVLGSYRRGRARRGRTSSGSSPPSRACASGRPRPPAPSQGESSRCSPSAAA